jgi:hypothetical protein
VRFAGIAATLILKVVEVAPAAALSRRGAVNGAEANHGAG